MIIIISLKPIKEYKHFLVLQLNIRPQAECRISQTKSFGLINARTKIGVEIVL